MYAQALHEVRIVVVGQVVAPDYRRVRSCQHRILVSGVDPVVEIRSWIRAADKLLLISDELGKTRVEFFFC